MIKVTLSFWFHCGNTDGTIELYFDLSLYHQDLCYTLKEYACMNESILTTDESVTQTATEDSAYFSFSRFHNNHNIKSYFRGANFTNKCSLMGPCTYLE